MRAVLTVMFTLSTACALAQSAPQPSPQAVEPNETAAARQRQNAALEEIAVQLKQLREHAIQVEQRVTSVKPQPGPPIWSNWVLIAVTGAAVVAAFRTLGQLKNQVASNEKAATAAQTSADAGKVAADAGSVAAELARASLILTHRPKLIVRNLDIRNLMDGHLGNSIDGHIWVTNIGFTSAHVRRLHTEWHVGDSLPMRNPVIIATPERISARLYPGRSKQLTIKPITDMTFDVHAAAYGDAEDPKKKLYLLGIVKYWDEMGNMRRTVFCRRWNVTSKRFEIVDDPDFEYAD